MRDGGAGHFIDCIQAIRGRNALLPELKFLTPDFRGRIDVAVDILESSPADVFNHNLETVPRLYKKARPGSDYPYSLNLLQRVKQSQPDVPTKSGIMLGLGEIREEVIQVMEDMRRHDINMVTLGQYLQPSRHHLAVEKYWSPEEFDEFRDIGEAMGFDNVASGPMVRSSYHADLQAKASI